MYPEIFGFERRHSVEILSGDSRKVLAGLPTEHFQTCVTSPPYLGLRDYGQSDQIGLEDSPQAYVEALVEVFREVRRILKPDGTCWINLGDSYARCGGTDRTVSSSAKVGNTRNSIEQRGDRTQKIPDGLKSKDLIGIPWRVAFALQEDGWYLRQDIVWNKIDPAPESVTDRCTKSHEYVFLLSKKDRYYFNAAAIREPTSATQRINFDYNDGIECQTTLGETRNRRSVWTIKTSKFKGAHFATMPEELVELCILSGSAEGDAVLDPFGGSGTTGVVARRLNRLATLVELNPAYAAIAKKRCEID